MNYDIIELPEEGNPKSPNQIVSKPEKWERLQSRKLTN